MEAVVTAGVWMAAALLVAAGVGKVAVPDAAMATLSGLSLPSGRGAARALGLAEIAVAGMAVTGGRGAALLGATYLALLVVAVAARRRELECGCFGAATGRLTRSHLAVDAAAATAGLAGLVWRPIAPLAVYDDAGVLGVVAAAVLLASAAALVRAALTTLPALRAASR